MNSDETLLSDLQVVLVPDRAFDRTDPTDYLSAQWQWSYAGVTSGWFATRDLAHDDAAAQNPGVGIG